MIRFTLDKCLEQKNITRYELAKRTGISFQIVDRYYKNKVSRFDCETLNRFCQALQCDISDLIEFVK